MVLKDLRMYKENVRSLNAWVGCNHGCVYCIPSFQRIAKRQKHRCHLCYTFTPHSHLERLDRRPPRTGPGEFIFFPSMGDLCFAYHKVIQAHIDFMNKYADRTFLIQSKNPKFFLDYKWPDNVILGSTIETNENYFRDTPSRFKGYWEISSAPYPSWRIHTFIQVQHENKALVLEPILDFTLIPFLEAIKKIGPKIVYIGYDNHKTLLPEPPLKKTEKLIREISRRFPEISLRLKTIREAWFE